MTPQLTAAVNPEGVKQGYTSPGGLFIPPIAPEEQKRQPQQIIQKPRSQAIPIVPPKVWWYNCIGPKWPLIRDGHILFIEFLFFLFFPTKLQFYHQNTNKKRLLVAVKLTMGQDFL